MTVYCKRSEELDSNSTRQWYPLARILFVNNYEHTTNLRRKEQPRTNQRENGANTNTIAVKKTTFIPTSRHPTIVDSFFHPVVNVTMYMQTIKMLLTCKEFQAHCRQVAWINIQISSHYLGSARNIAALLGKTQEWFVKSQNILLFRNYDTAATSCPSSDPRAYSCIVINIMPHIINSMTISTDRHRLKAPRI